MGFSANSCSLLPLALKRSLSLAAFCFGVCSVLVFLCSGEEVLGKLSARSHRAMDTICHKLLWMGGGVHRQGQALKLDTVSRKPGAVVRS